MPVHPVEEYLHGQRLYGDDMSPEEIKAWYRDEEEGYADLGAADRTNYKYEYHAWNERHAFRHIPPGQVSHALGFGSAYGEEFLPIIDRIEKIAIVDPSGAFIQSSIGGVPATYVKPDPQGVLPFASDSFDVITCFGVLHHIPNVTAVVCELSRVLRNDGCLLLREPIVSMGDWRHSRVGLTKNERGIPLNMLRSIMSKANLKIEYEALVGFPVVEKGGKLLKQAPYNSRAAVRIDHVASKLFAWNVNYHATSILQKLRPTGAALVLSKR